MKNSIVLALIILMITSLHSEYQIGDVCDNLNWTDSNGLETSVYDQIDRGKVVFLFFGQSW